MAESWQQTAQSKRQKRDAQIPKEWRIPSLPSSEQIDLTNVPRDCGVLNQLELDITEDYDATALAEAVSSRKFRAVDVTVAFCKRAAVAQQVANCLSEMFFDIALKRAKALDHFMDLHGKPIGPLHGIPISLKDTFKIPGIDSTIGFVALADKPSLSMSPLVSLLLSAGAVIYCKTNLPQTIMALDTVNNVFGRTLNPMNTRVTAGGSSGGEGALMAMGGSILGVGTDIGGSIRIPAFCNNIYGCMPSAHRIPYANQQESGPASRASVALESRAGPLTRSIRDAELFLKSVLQMKPWNMDPLVIPGNWESMDSSNFASRSSESDSKRLVFGILSTDNVTQPLPPIRNLLKETAVMLKNAGHAVVSLQTPSSFSRIQSLANSLMGLDGGESIFQFMQASGEPFIPWLAGRMKQRPPRTTAEAVEMHRLRTEIRTEMIQKLWQTPDGREIDALICPVAPHPVPGIDRWGGVGYTSAFVYLDCCAGTVPVRKFVEEDMMLEFGKDELEVLGSWDHRNRLLWQKEERSTYLGTGMSVQVVAPRLQERRLIRAMSALDASVKGTAWQADAPQIFSKDDRDRLPFAGAAKTSSAKL